MNADYERVAKAIRFLEQNFESQPSLEQLAAELGLSPFHFQRLFHRWSGITPKRFLQFLTVEYAKQLLDQSQSVLSAAYETGLSSPARLHDHFVSLEAVTPGEYKHKGAGLRIRYGVHPSPFGSVFLALTERGVCALRFLGRPPALDVELDSLKQLWNAAELSEDRAATGSVVEQIFSAVNHRGQKLTLLVKGTNFQVKVWKALLDIPPGLLCSYEQIASSIGRPSASRAVGQAIAANPIAYLIPCHRVIRSIGTIGGYRWSPIRKRAMIAWEAARFTRSIDSVAK